MNHNHLLALSVISLLLTSGCAGRDRDMPPAVTGFEPDRYAGTWYEIVRLPHSFEKNLSDVTATYTLRDDGKITVLNRGYNTKTGKWQSAEGSAYVVDANDADRSRGLLRVTFFWPFYADYRIIALDKENYQWAMVTSSSREYLWILARSPAMMQTLKDELLEKARRWGFPTEKIIHVTHKRS